MKVIESAVEEDPKKDFSFSQFRDAVATLKNSIQTRYEYLVSNAEIARRAPEIRSASLVTVATSNNQVPVVASVTGAPGEGVDSVFVHYTPQGRIDSYEVTEMFDDGNHNDNVANDGVYLSLIHI